MANRVAITRRVKSPKFSMNELYNLVSELEELSNVPDEITELSYDKHLGELTIVLEDTDEQG